MRVRSTRRSLLVAGAVALASVLVGCGADSVKLVKGRTDLPAISGTLLQGGDYDSHALLGKVVVYNIWGSWCAPCREEAPVLAKVSKQTRVQGVRFIGINVRDNDAAARAFERSYDLSYPSIDTASSQQAPLAVGSTLPPSAVTSTMVVDREGRLATRIIGKTSYGTLFALIADVVAESKQQ